MAIIYLRSTDGSDSDNGSTWALAKASLTGALAAAAAGDTIYVSQAHTESIGVTTTWTTPGTLPAPVKIICVNDGAEPPTALATGASIAQTATNINMTITGSFYAYGMAFNAGQQFNVGPTSSANEAHLFENCDIRTQNTGSIGEIVTSGTSAGQYTRLINCGFRFSGANNGMRLGHRTDIIGGSVLAGGTSPTNLIRPADLGRGGSVFVSGFDFSNLASTFNLVNGGSTGSGVITLRNCRLPTSWSGAGISATITAAGLRLRMHNTDAADTNYRFLEQDYAGSVRSETTVYRDGGATDGTTPISWRMASSANTSFPTQPLQSPDLPAVWNTTVGSSVTATVEIVHDGASALNNDEIWLEVHYLGTSGATLGVEVSDARAILASAAAQATSAATWTGDTGTGPNGSSTWNTLKLECTFTPQEVGYIQARVMLAKPSTTVFVDPKITVA